MVVEQFPVAGDVAQFVQAPVTGMLPFGGGKIRTASLSVPSLHHKDPVIVVASSTPVLKRCLRLP